MMEKYLLMIANPDLKNFCQKIGGIRLRIEKKGIMNSKKFSFIALFVIILIFCSMAYAGQNGENGPQIAPASQTAAAAPQKIFCGLCGCGIPDTDSDGDGDPDCNDLCPSDPDKDDPGYCGCNIADTDSDGDGVSDCIDSCPLDLDKVDPGACGCGVPDTDSDGDGIPDCIENSPVDCIVSDWSSWGTCSATCGGGDQTRTRAITTQPSYGGAACPDLTETQACNTNPCPVDCVVSDWSSWGTCSAACGGGDQTRTRTITTQPSIGGAACPDLTETQACNTNPCPVDCVVSDWSSWGTCSAACGGGDQTRTRTITTQPSYGGAACPDLTETQACNTNPCPVDCPNDMCHEIEANGICKNLPDAPGHTWCFDSYCSQLTQDVNNCGACGNVCDPGQVCNGGKCKKMKK
jgi:hypothetical protein